MGDIEFSVKCPSRPALGDFKLRVPVSATVREVKQRLQASYPGNPEPACITAIYAGRVLKDENAVLSDFVVPNVDPSCPQSLHIVIKPPGTSSSTPQPQQQQQPQSVSSSGASTSSATAQPASAPAALVQENRASNLDVATQAATMPPPATRSSTPDLDAVADDAMAAGLTGAPPTGVAYMGMPPGYPGLGMAAGVMPTAGFAAPAGVPPSVPLPGFAYAPAMANPAAAYAMYTPALQAAYSAALQVLQQQAAAGAQPVGQQQAAGGNASATPAASAATTATAGSTTGSTAAADAAGSAAGAEGTPMPGATGPAAQPQPGAAAGAAAPISLPMPQPLFQQPAIAFVPTLIPVPQPVLPAYLTANQGAAGGPAEAGQQQEGGQGGAAAARVPGAAQGAAPGQVLVAPMMPYPLYPHPMHQAQVQYIPAQLRHRGRRQAGQLPGAIADMLRQQQQRGPLPAPLAELLRRHDAAVAAAAAAAGQPGAEDARGGAQAGGMAAAQGAAGQPAQRRAFPNVIVRLNMRAILQLLVLMVVVYQHCPPGRFLMLVGLGLLMYLTATEPVRRFLNRLAGVHQAAAAAPRRQPGAAGAAAAAAPQQQPQQQGPAEGGGRAAAAPPQPAAGAAPVAQPAVAPNAAEAAAAPAPQQAQERQRGGLLREMQALVVGFFTSLVPGWNVNPDDAAAIAAAQQIFAEEEEAARQAGVGR